MFFRRTERKRHSACFILAVGALATIGAISVVRYSKQMIGDAGCKIKAFMKKDKCTCPVNEE